ncbi:50S ribosomal protein L35 [bacterium]|nr:MAG: 50S ribosomal protein L35 [bacterium]
MPKMKTNSGAKKRFQLTGKGKLMRKKATARHLLSSKSNRRKSDLGGKHLVDDTDVNRVLTMLGKK